MCVTYSDCEYQAQYVILIYAYACVCIYVYALPYPYKKYTNLIAMYVCMYAAYMCACVFIHTHILTYIHAHSKSADKGKTVASSRSTPAAKVSPAKPAAAAAVDLRECISMSVC